MPHKDLLSGSLVGVPQRAVSLPSGVAAVVAVPVAAGEAVAGATAVVKAVEKIVPEARVTVVIVWLYYQQEQQRDQQ